MHELSATASSSAVHEELATARKAAEEASAAAEAAKRDSLKHRGLLEIATAQADALELKQAVRGAGFNEKTAHCDDMPAAVGWAYNLLCVVVARFPRKKWRPCVSTCVNLRRHPTTR